MAGEPVVFGLEVKGADAVARAYAQVTAEVTKAAEAEKAASASAKSITAAATAQADALKEAGRQSAVTAQAARAVAPAAEAAAAGMKSAASAGQNLRFQLADVFTSLAGGMNPLMVLSQQGPQIAEAFGGAAKGADVFKAATFGLLPTIGPIIAAVGALGLAYVKITGEMSRAAESTRILHGTKERLLAVTMRETQSQIDLAVALGVLTRAQGQAQKAQIDAQTSVKAVAAGQAELRAELNKTIDTANNVRDVFNKGIFGNLPGTLGEVATKANVVGRFIGSTVDSMFGLSEGADEARTRIGYLDSELALSADSIANTTDNTIDKIKADEEAAKAVTKHGAAVRDVLPALGEYRLALDGLYPVGLAQSGSDLIKQINAIAPVARTAADTVNELEAALGAINLARLTGKIGADMADGLVFQVESKLGDIKLRGLTAALSDSFVSSASASMSKLQADAERMAAEAQRRIDQRTQRIGQGIGSALSGDLMGGLGAAVGRSPVGDAVMAGVQGLGALGAQGADATAKQIEATAMGVVKGMKEIGPLLEKLVPMLAVELPIAIIKAIPAIVAGIAEGILGIAANFGRMLWDVFTFGDSIRQWWDGMGGWGGITTALRDWWRDVWSAIKDFFTRTDKEKEASRNKFWDTTEEILTLGFAQTETYNGTREAASSARTAPTYRPQAAMFAAPSPAGGGGLAGAAGGGGAVHIHMPPGLILGTADEVVRKLSQHMGTGGRRLSLPPGSVRG